MITSSIVQKTLVCPRALTSSSSDFALGSVGTQHWEAVRGAELLPKNSASVSASLTVPELEQTKTTVLNMLLMPCSSLLVGRRGARRTDRDCVLTKEAYLDVCLYFHTVAKNFIWTIAPLPDGLDARFC